MTSLLSSSSSINTSHLFFGHRVLLSPPTHPRKITTLQFGRKKQTISPSSTNQDSESDKNVFIKLAWYSAELLGIAASFFQPPAKAEPRETVLELAGAASGVVDRAQVTESIKEDFQQSYFITGNLTLDAYEEDCEFADPAASFKGLRRFKRNCTNFGSLIEKSNMRLTNWEEFQDKGIGHWSFSAVLLFPWRPTLSATGYTEYYFDPETGRVCRHAEHWNVPKMALLKQILRPGTNKKLTEKKTDI